MGPANSLLRYCAIAMFIIYSFFVEYLNEYRVDPLAGNMLWPASQAQQSGVHVVNGSVM